LQIQKKNTMSTANESMQDMQQAAKGIVRTHARLFMTQGGPLG
jgi:hypothetical protein